MFKMEVIGYRIHDLGLSCASSPAFVGFSEMAIRIQGGLCKERRCCGAWGKSHSKLLKAAVKPANQLLPCLRPNKRYEMLLHRKNLRHIVWCVRSATSST